MIKAFGIWRGSKEINFETRKEKGKMINRQTIDVVFENAEEVEEAIRDITQEINQMESSLKEIQEMKELLTRQKEMLEKLKEENYASRG